MDQEPKKHHFIPQFWIKNWCDETGKAQRFTVPRQGVFSSLKKPPKAIGVVKGLYDFPAFDGGRYNLEALFFRHLDQDASHVFEKIKADDNPNLSRAEVGCLSVFVLSLFLRSPEKVEALLQSSRLQLNTVRKSLEPKYASLRTAKDPQFCSEYIANDGEDSYKTYFARSFIPLIVNEKLISFLSSMHWRRITRHVDSNQFLLSDDPVVRTNGFKIPTGHLAFPLTPNIALVAAYKEDFLTHLLSMEAKVFSRSLNERVVESARRFVVATDERQRRFIRNHFGRSPQTSLAEQMLRKLQEG